MTESQEVALPSMELLLNTVTFGIVKKKWLTFGGDWEHVPDPGSRIMIRRVRSCGIVLSLLQMYLTNGSLGVALKYHYVILYFV